MGAKELSMQLWQERELLELLLYKLEVEQMLLAAGRSQWVQQAAREIEQVVEHLRTASLARAVEVSALAVEWGVDEDATLRRLIEAAPEPVWRDVFADHLRALTRITAQIAQVRDTTAEQLGAVLRATQETIAGLGVDTGEYDTKGGRAKDASARIIDTRM